MTDTLSIYSNTDESQDLTTEGRLQCDNQPDNLPNLIPISFFAYLEDTGNHKHFDGWNRPLPWSDIVFVLEKFSQTEYKDKEAAWLFCPTVFRMERQRKKDGTWDTGWRNELNMTTSSMIPIDFDKDAGFDFASVHDWLVANEIEAVLYTSASHTIAAPRLRLVVPLAGEIDPTMHTVVVNSIVSAIRPNYRLKDTSKSY